MKASLRQEEVQHTLRCGKRYARDGLVVCVAGGGSGRFAVLVSKKVARSAVVRNRMRRVLREVVRSLGRMSFDFVVLQNKKNISNEDMHTSLQMLLPSASETQ